MKHRQRPKPGRAIRRWATVAVLAWAVVAPAQGHAGQTECRKKEEKSKYFVRYILTDDCDVYPNYPKPGVKGQKFKWQVDQGSQMVWRYNVNDTWAVVQDPRRAEKKKFPWWGFAKRSCLGKSTEQHDYPSGVSLPTAIKIGRSRKKGSCGWAKVTYDQGPVNVVRHDVRVKRNATLRDATNFLVGNVFAGWKVDVTNHTRKDGHWVYVYSPSARKWGYIENYKLDL